MNPTTCVPDPYPPGVNPPWTTTGHEDPHPWFIAMAADRPVAYDQNADVWHFCGHTEVQDFLRACDLWSTAKRLEQVPPDQRVVRLLTSEPPLHVEVRKRFSHAYRPTRIAAMEERIREVCQDLLEDCLAKGTFDITTDLAEPLTTTVISQLLGIPPESEKLIRSITRARREASLGKIVPPESDSGPILYMGGVEPAEAAAVHDLFTELVAERRRNPQDDLISDLAALPPEEFELRLDIGALLFEQLGAGQNTTTHLLGSLAYFLDRFPDQQRLLREQPKLTRTAIEETVRFSSPLQARPRVSTRPIELGGTTIPEGATGLAWLQAANLDARHFEDPTRYDITRWPNQHAAFGFGEHYCLGANLARMEARVVLEELIGRTRWFVRDTERSLIWVEDFILRGPTSVEIEVVPV